MLKVRLNLKVIAIAICLTSSVTMFAQKETGVKIGETTWATRNVSTPGNFVSNPEGRGMLFQWNSKVGWSNADPLTPSDGTSVWNGEWDGGGTASWILDNNPCPSGWRIPTKEECESLIAAGCEWLGNGARFGSGDNTIFLPSVTRRNSAGILSDEGYAAGDYWSSSDITGNTAFGFYFEVYGVNTEPNYEYSEALSIRCVKDESSVGINSISSDIENATVTGYFDIMGRKLKEEPATGIYIIQYSNGITKKVSK